MSRLEPLEFSDEGQNGLLSHETVKQYGYGDFQELGLLSEKGKIRLAPAQRYFNQNADYSLLPQLFEAWRDEREYMVFRRVSDGKVKAVKCSKRGNDVYVSRVKKRFRLFEHNIEDTKFFDVADAFKVDKVVRTRLLWVTLTWNSTKFPSIRRSWWGKRRVEWKMKNGKNRCSDVHVTEGCRCVSCEWNRWIAAVRSRYGKVSVLRSWEASQRGYPHVHAVLSFESSEFKVFPWFNEKDGRMSFRIQEKHEFDSLWGSNTDIEAISSSKKLASYVMKYQLKVNEGREDNRSDGQVSMGSKAQGSKTLAFMWLFSKRSYSMSKSLQGLFSRLDNDLHNSKMVKKDFWELLGVFSGSELGLHGEWSVDVSDEQLGSLL